MAISVSTLKEQNKKFDEVVNVIEIEQNGKIEMLKFYPFFSYDKIRKCTLELLTFYENAQKEKIEIDPLEEDDIVNYFIMRHFCTGITLTKSKKAKTIYNEFMVIYRNDLYKLMKETVFESEIVEKSKEDLYKEIFALLEKSAKLENKFKQMQKMIQDLPLENKDIIMSAFGNKDVAKNVVADKVDE